MMLEAQAHIFWEKAAVLMGIFLILEGLYTISNTNNKTFKKLAFVRIILGGVTILVDGFLFLPSWS